MKPYIAVLIAVVFSANAFCGALSGAFLYPEKENSVYFSYSENYFERDVKYDVVDTWFWKNLENRPGHPSAGMRQSLLAAWKFTGGFSLLAAADYVSQKITGYDQADSREVAYNYNEFQSLEVSVSYPAYGLLFTAGYGIPLFSRDYRDNRLLNLQPGNSVFAGAAYALSPWIFELEAYAKAEFFITVLNREFMKPIEREYSGGVYAGISFYKDEYQKAGAGFAADVFSEDAPDLQSLRVIFIPQARVEFTSGLAVMAGAEILYYADSVYERGADKIFYTARIIYTPQLGPKRYLP